MSRPVLIMAGGTGGHVFPALALARLLREQSLEVVWLGTARGLEARVIPAEGILLERLSVGGLRGKGALTWLGAPFRLSIALAQALIVMWRHRPLIAVGLGGYVCGPGGVAAWLTRRPLVIHEQNAIAGFTNRCLAHLARQVLEAFPGSFGRDVHARLIGNPVRRDITALPPPSVRFAGRTGPIRILVIGGSQGATRLNAVVPFALKRLSGWLAFDVRHQAGERWIDAGRASYAQAGVRAD
ncbi:MAG TPA: UDP-N-acetylglucosamine--N-acetylmuramyl-(pentapeptide) pyrophosphoryl-undecaprenol N-acetylglucosamine transferase, partial [Steroidobacteraceae bacterium]|nr:UDP-N-acetylglucosamine--N-acetylmuramyl-(pentapeptide) pyrophosphoryl-undecaprenol N-acetylglucosamine transferase [Steroidobacteraceae bacterium]